jgi:hypothetical protein
MTCKEAVKRLLKDKKRWEVRSAGKGSKGDRWYAEARDRQSGGLGACGGVTG